MRSTSPLREPLALSRYPQASSSPPSQLNASALDSSDLLLASPALFAAKRGPFMPPHPYPSRAPTQHMRRGNNSLSISSSRTSRILPRRPLATRDENLCRSQIYSSCAEQPAAAGGTKLRVFREVVFRLSDRLQHKRTLQAIFNSLVDIDSLAQRAVLSHDLALQEAINASSAQSSGARLHLLDESAALLPTAPRSNMATPIESLVQSISGFLSRAKRKIAKVVDTQKMVSQQYLDKLHQLQLDLHQSRPALSTAQPHQTKQIQSLRNQLLLAQQQVASMKQDLANQRRTNGTSLVRERDAHRAEVAELSTLASKLRASIIDLEDENAQLSDKNKRLERRNKQQDFTGSSDLLPAQSERSSGYTSRGVEHGLRQRLSEERREREEEAERLGYAIRRAEKEAKLKEIEIEEIREEMARLKIQRERGETALQEQLKEARKAIEIAVSENAEEMRKVLEMKNGEMLEMEKKARGQVEDARIEQNALRAVKQDLQKKLRQSESKGGALNAENQKLQTELEQVLSRFAELQKSVMELELGLREKDALFDELAKENADLRTEAAQRESTGQAQGEAAEFRIKELEAENQEVTRALEERETRLRNVEEQVARLQEKLALKQELEDIVIRASNELKAKDARIQDLEATQGDAELHRAERQAAERRRQEAESRFAALEEMREAEKRELAEAQEQADVQRQAVQALEQRMASVSQQQGAETKQILQLQRALDAQEGEVRHLRGLLRNAEQDAQAKRAGIEKAEVVIKKLNNESQLILDENARLANEFDKLEKHAEELAMQLTEAAHRIREVEPLVHAQQEADQARQELVARRLELSQREKELEELAAEHSELQAQSEAERETAQKLEQRAEAAESAQELAETKNAELEGVQTKLEAELKEAKEQLKIQEKQAAEQVKQVCSQAERTVAMYMEQRSEGTGAIHAARINTTFTVSNPGEKDGAGGEAEPVDKLGVVVAQEAAFQAINREKQRETEITEFLEKELQYVAKRLQESEQTAQEQRRVAAGLAMRAEELETRLFAERRQSARVAGFLVEIKSVLKDKEAALQRYKQLWLRGSAQLRDTQKELQAAVAREESLVLVELTALIEAQKQHYAELAEETGRTAAKGLEVEKARAELVRVEQAHQEELARVLGKLSEAESGAATQRKERAVLREQLEEVMSLFPEKQVYSQMSLIKRVKELLVDNKQLVGQLVQLQTKPEEVEYLESQNQSLLEQLEHWQTQHRSESVQQTRHVEELAHRLRSAEGLLQQKEIIINNLNQQMENDARAREELREMKEEEQSRHRAESGMLRGQLDGLREDLERARKGNLELQKQLHAPPQDNASSGVLDSIRETDQRLKELLAEQRRRSEDWSCASQGAGWERVLQEKEQQISSLEHCLSTQKFEIQELEDLRKENEKLHKENQKLQQQQQAQQQQATSRSRNSVTRGEYSFAKQTPRARHDSVPSSHVESAYFPPGARHSSQEALQRKVEKLESRKDLRKRKHQKQLRDIDCLLRHLEAKVLLTGDETRYTHALGDLCEQNPSLAKWLEQLSGALEQLHKLSRGGQVFALEIFSTLDSDQKREVLSELGSSSGGRGSAEPSGPLETELEKKIKALLLDPRLLAKTAALIKGYARSEFGTESVGTAAHDNERGRLLQALEGSLGAKAQAVREVAERAGKLLMALSSSSGARERQFGEVFISGMRAVSAGLESDLALLGYFHLNGTFQTFDAKGQELFGKLWSQVDEGLDRLRDMKDKQPAGGAGGSSGGRSGMGVREVLRDYDKRLGRLLRDVPEQSLSKTTAYLVRLFDSSDPQVEQFMAGFEVGFCREKQADLKNLRAGGGGGGSERRDMREERKAVERCVELIATLNETERGVGPRRWREAVYLLLAEHLEIREAVGCC